MRKFLLFLLVIVLLGATLFYFGWIQFQIPESSYGVVFTKTNGWESEPISAGTFAWRWQRLLPTNLQLYVYPVEPQRVSVRAEGTLPSSEVYTGALPSSVDFSYSVVADVRYVVKPGELPSLAAEEGIDPAGLDEWYSGLATSIQEELVSSLVDTVSRSEQPASVAQVQESAAEALAQRFPSLEFLGVSVSSIRFPDYDLYTTAKELYLAALRAREFGIAEAKEIAAFTETRQKSRIDLLRQYGQILSEYPVLLEYFTMSAEKGIDPLQIEELRSAAEEGR